MKPRKWWETRAPTAMNWEERGNRILLRGSSVHRNYHWRKTLEWWWRDSGSFRYLLLNLRNGKEWSEMIPQIHCVRGIGIKLTPMATRPSLPNGFPTSMELGGDYLGMNRGLLFMYSLDKRLQLSLVAKCYLFVDSCLNSKTCCSVLLVYYLPIDTLL